MPTPEVPVIRRLSIRRFRGIADLSWCPEKGVNVILGGGDVGKSTILDAIAWLLRPTGSTNVSDTDYRLRDVEQGFEIEAAFSLPDSIGINELPRMVFPWGWNGEEAVVPDPQEVGPPNDPVYVLRVRGTSDFEVYHEIVQPNGSTEYLPVGIRRGIGVVLVSGPEANRDLRLVYGSALDRLLADSAIRARLAHEVGREDIEAILKEEGRASLAALDESFGRRALPTGLGLGLVESRRVSLAALVGLTAEKEEGRLPLSSWGAGTQRLASLEVAAANQTGTPVILIDEVERGLEPYRQRQLVGRLREGPSQVFMTSHSPAAIAAALPAALWHIAPNGTIAQLTGAAVGHAKKNPEAFLSRFVVVAEGATEVGLLTELLTVALGHELSSLGLAITDAEGNDGALALLEATSRAGLKVGGLVDDDGTHTGRWAAVKADLADFLLQWPKACTEEVAMDAVPGDRLEALIHNEDKTGERLRTLQERLGTRTKQWTDLVEAADDIRRVMVEAATGQVPEGVEEPAEAKRFKKHSQHWFKGLDGGRELFLKILELGAWPEIEPMIWPLVTALAAAVGQTAKPVLGGEG